MTTENSLLKFQIGPVQDFIAQARSTRDLWSGSYLLSWLVSKGIKEALKKENGANLIFPAKDGQPLLQESLNAEALGILTPNLPNIFIAEVPAGIAGEVATKVEAAICEEWKNIAKDVWGAIASKLDVAVELKTRFDAQVERHLSISWQVTPIEKGCYAEAYKVNGWHLDAVRQMRDFKAWYAGDGHTIKDSLSGKEEAILGGEAFREKMEKRGGEYPSLFAKHADHLGAVSVIKRCWHLAFLQEKKSLPTGSKKFKIRSIPAIAARTPKLDDEEEAQEKAQGDNYIAAIAFDGDSIGKWVNGDYLPSGADLRSHHTDFSNSLSRFALDQVRATVEVEVDGRDREQRTAYRVPLGQLIYAGGDDVVALVPADAALEVARNLRKEFQDATKGITGQENGTPISPDASVGIAIAHIHSPLQDLIREAQKAEKRAKKDGPKPAFSVTLMKRSGEISYWTARWESGAPELYDAIFQAMKNRDLSAKFPHRLCELLEPYLCAKSGIGTQQGCAGFEVEAVILKEFLHTAERQGNQQVAQKLGATLKTHLDRLSGEPQSVLDSIIKLATTLAFIFRNLPKEKPTAERQSAMP